MKKLLTAILISILVNPLAAVTVQVFPRDFTSGTPNYRNVTATLTGPNGQAVAGPWIIVGDSVTLNTGTNGSVTFSNMLALGEYRLDVSGNPSRSFPFSLSVTSGVFNVVQLIGTNNSVELFYDSGQVDALLGQVNQNASNYITSSITNDFKGLIAVSNNYNGTFTGLTTGQVYSTSITNSENIQTVTENVTGLLSAQGGVEGNLAGASTTSTNAINATNFFGVISPTNIPIGIALTNPSIYGFTTNRSYIDSTSNGLYWLGVGIVGGSSFTNAIEQGPGAGIGLRWTGSITNQSLANIASNYLWYADGFDLNFPQGFNSAMAVYVNAGGAYIQGGLYDNGAATNTGTLWLNTANPSIEMTSSGSALYFAGDNSTLSSLSGGGFRFNDGSLASKPVIKNGFGYFDASQLTNGNFNTLLTNVGPQSLIGNSSGSTANAQDVPIGPWLTFSGGSLTVATTNWPGATNAQFAGTATNAITATNSLFSSTATSAILATNAINSAVATNGAISGFFTTGITNTSTWADLGQIHALSAKVDGTVSAQYFQANTNPINWFSEIALSGIGKQGGWDGLYWGLMNANNGTNINALIYQNHTANNALSTPMYIYAGSNVNSTVISGGNPAANPVAIMDGAIYGNLGGGTNLPPAGIWTNGGLEGQVPRWAGGTVVWSNGNYSTLAGTATNGPSSGFFSTSVTNSGNVQTATLNASGTITAGSFAGNASSASIASIATNAFLATNAINAAITTNGASSGFFSTSITNSGNIQTATENVTGTLTANSFAGPLTGNASTATSATFATTTTNGASSGFFSSSITNSGNIQTATENVTGVSSYSSLASFNTIVVTNGITNQSLTANGSVYADGNGRLSSISAGGNQQYLRSGTPPFFDSLWGTNIFGAVSNANIATVANGLSSGSPGTNNVFWTDQYQTNGIFATGKFITISNQNGTVVFAPNGSQTNSGSIAIGAGGFLLAQSGILNIGGNGSIPGNQPAVNIANNTFNASSGLQIGANFTPTDAQTGSGTFQGVNINPQISSTGSGGDYALTMGNPLSPFNVWDMNGNQTNSGSIQATTFYGRFHGTADNVLLSSTATNAIIATNLVINAGITNPLIQVVGYGSPSSFQIRQPSQNQLMYIDTNGQFYVQDVAGNPIFAYSGAPLATENVTIAKDNGNAFYSDRFSTKIYDGSANLKVTVATNAVTIATNTVITGSIGYRLLTASKTANYVVSVNDSGTDFDNNGAVVNVTNSLPPASYGLVYEFDVAANFTFCVQANGSDTIRSIGTVSVGGGQVFSSTVGSCLRMKAKNGSWWISSTNGVWTIQ